MKTIALALALFVASCGGIAADSETKSALVAPPPANSFCTWISNSNCMADEFTHETALGSYACNGTTFMLSTTMKQIAGPYPYWTEQFLPASGSHGSTQLYLDCTAGAGYMNDYMVYNGSYLAGIYDHSCKVVHYIGIHSVSHAVTLSGPSLLAFPGNGSTWGTWFFGINVPVQYPSDGLCSANMSFGVTI